MARTAGKGSVVIHDRYSAMGTPRPDPKTVCLGPCEGMGVVPLTLAGAKRYGLEVAWWDAAASDTDEYQFLKCPICKGTGKRTTPAKCPRR